MRFVLIVMILLWGAPPLPAAALSPQQQRGLELLQGLGCKSCHRFRRQGANLAGPLDGVGRRYSWKELDRLINRASPSREALHMPRYRGLTPQESQALDAALSIPLRVYP